MAPRDPREKKALSYAKDRRNVYGANDKASRKGIRRGKRSAERANRRRAAQAMTEATDVRDSKPGDDRGRGHGDERGELADRRLHAKKAKRWRKWADAPLGEVVASKLQRRAAAEDERLRRRR